MKTTTHAAQKTKIKTQLQRNKNACALRLVGVLAFALTTSACINKNPGTPINIQTMSGAWYGEKSDGLERTIWLTKRSDQGDFTTEFKKCDKNKTVFTQQKTGKWMMAGNLYTTITTELSDGKQSWQPATPNRQFVESYTINNLKNQTLAYEDHEQRFTANKVADDFELDCQQ